ncbi:hypothetical protein FLX56_15180 [Synechococcus moorigangaii CMS01]|nr:hypothetical protein [Synechococcus moorigangaii CMS01]
MSRSFLSAAVGLALFCGALSALPAIAQDRSFWLYNGDETTLSGYFYAGEEIYGDCDEDCYDLDFYLYNSVGELVDSDTLDDAYPIVQAPYEGDYTLRVVMYDCAHTAGCAVEVSSDYGF